MDGWKFGGFCHEAWRSAYRFFGTGEQLLFTFEGDEDDPLIYRWQGGAEQHQYADAKSIGLGGSKEKGRFALYISEDLYRGSSNKVETYENEPLSKNIDFKCNHVEVWGITD